MRLVITQNLTVDGSAEMLGDWFDPTAQDEELLALTHEQDERCDAVLLGRQTFEDFRSFWPEQTDDATGITDFLTAVPKYVVSSTLREPGWANTTVLCGDPVAEAARLRELPGRDLVLTGSIRLCHTLIGAGLVDEFRLFTYPVVQGRGRRLFPDGWACEGLELLDARVFGSVNYAAYAPGAQQ